MSRRDDDRYPVDDPVFPLTLRRFDSAAQKPESDRSRMRLTPHQLPDEVPEFKRLLITKNDASRPSR